MKFAVAFVVAFIFICGTTALVTTEWGDVRAAKYYAYETVVRPPNNQHFTKVDLTFPKNNPMKNVTILGIKQVDFEHHASTCDIVKGGIGFNNVTLEIWSPIDHGINSTFTFYLA